MGSGFAKGGDGEEFDSFEVVDGFGLVPRDQKVAGWASALST